jgi:hypothetical protein
MGWNTLKFGFRTFHMPGTNTFAKAALVAACITPPF